MPWSSDPGDPKHPKISWGEYAWSKAPIPLSAAAGFVYDQLRNAGASVHDASMWIRAAMVGGVLPRHWGPSRRQSRIRLSIGPANRLRSDTENPGYKKFLNHWHAIHCLAYQ